MKPATKRAPGTGKPATKTAAKTATKRAPAKKRAA
jgi:ribosome-associated protein